MSLFEKKTVAIALGFFLLCVFRFLDPVAVLPKLSQHHGGVEAEEDAERQGYPLEQIITVTWGFLVPMTHDQKVT